MTPNGDRFLAAYNEIDTFLRRKLRRDKWARFSSVLVEAATTNATVRAHKDDLLEYGELRNAIVHDLGRAPVLLADPRDEIVERIEKIWRQLSRPRVLRSIPLPVPIRIFEDREFLPDALTYMRANDFSQIVAFRAQTHVILSAEGIAHWLEAKSKEHIIELSEVTLCEVLEFEPRDTCIYLKADDTVDYAREVFAKDIGKRVFSALVTEIGTAKQRPINIVTPWHFVAGNLR